TFPLRDLPLECSGLGLCSVVRNEQRMNRVRKETLQFAALALGVFCLRYPFLALGTRTLFDVDWSIFCQPVAEYNKFKLLSGEMPFWCPLLANGVPYFAQWNTLLCYP